MGVLVCYCMSFSLFRNGCVSAGILPESLSLGGLVSAHFVRARHENFRRLSPNSWAAQSAPSMTLAPSPPLPQLATRTF